MATLMQKGGTPKSGTLTEVSWDPITRIVGSLGIFTKIDFANRVVADARSTSSIFRGYSIFMKGKDPRDAHFITSRICGICGDNHATCATYAQNMAFGIKPPAIAEWIVNLGEAAEYMFDHNIFQDNLLMVDFCEQMVKETNPSVLAKAENTPAPHAGDHGYRTIADIMRALNPFTGEFYRETLHVSPLHARDVLPDGGAARPSLHAVPGRRRHRSHRAALHRLPRAPHEVRGVHEEGGAAARRHLRLLLRGAARLRGGGPAPHGHRLLGIVQRPGGVRLHLQAHGRVGQGDVRHPGVRRRRQAGDHRPRRHQPQHPHPSRPFLLRRLGQLRDLRHHATRSATPSTSAIRGTRPPCRARRSATSTTSTAG